jgi:hypothetical protein
MSSVLIHVGFKCGGTRVRVFGSIRHVVPGAALVQSGVQGLPVALASKMIWLWGWGDVVQLYCCGGCGGQDLGQVQGKIAAISDKAMQIHKPKLGVRKGFSTRKAVHLVVVDVAPCKINQSCPEVRGNKFQMPQRRGVAALVSGLLKQR